MFLVPIYEPGSSCSRADQRQRLIFLLFKNTFTDKVSLIFRASIHQIEEKKRIKLTLLSKALTSEIKICSNPVVLNNPALIEKRGLRKGLNWYSNLAGFTHPGLLVALFKVIRSLTKITYFNYPSVFTPPSSNVVHSCAVINPCVFFLDIRISKNRI